jgi:CHAD domain-containing protein
MAYRIPFDRELDDSLRQIARDELVEAIRLLRDDYADDPVTAVHDARKNLKKTRALLRLARPGLAKQVYRRENAAIRDAARLISGARDADVMLQTVDRLAKRDDSRVGREEFASLRSRLASPADRTEHDDQTHHVDPTDQADHPPTAAAVATLTAPATATAAAVATAIPDPGDFRDGPETGPDAGSPAAVIEALGAVVARIDDWPLRSDWSTVGRGISRAYRRGRDAFVEADVDPTTEHLHDWRKRVKDLWYHQRLLNDAWPELIAVQAEEAHRLSELLGDDHDLGVLAERLGGVGSGAGGVGSGSGGNRDADADGDLAASVDRDAGGSPGILELVGEARAELLRDARRLGRRVYAETGEAFTTRIVAYLRSAEAEAARDASS